ncbi:MAG: 4Fe-4S binding protein, partial [Muribaculaceae bacterium]|nr:4Fe-4S binding protein [Muribaculaceae bacterium]
GKQPSFSARRCTACWRCVEACPRHALEKVKFFWHIHAVLLRGRCIACNLCVKTCPNGCFRSNNETCDVK